MARTQSSSGSSVPPSLASAFSASKALASPPSAGIPPSEVVPPWHPPLGSPVGAASCQPTMPLPPEPTPTLCPAVPPLLPGAKGNARRSSPQAAVVRIHAMTSGGGAFFAMTCARDGVRPFTLLVLVLLVSKCQPEC